MLSTLYTEKKDSEIVTIIVIWPKTKIKTFSLPDRRTTEALKVKRNQKTV